MKSVASVTIITTTTLKDRAHRIQEICKELGYNLKLGHAYELMAVLHGYKSWNSMSAQEQKDLEVHFCTSISKKESEAFECEFDGVIELGSGGTNTYTVNAKSEAEVTLPLRISASSKEEALKIAQDYICSNPPNNKWIPSYVDVNRAVITDAIDGGDGDELNSSWIEQILENWKKHGHETRNGVPLHPEFVYRLEGKWKGWNHYRSLGSEFEGIKVHNLNDKIEDEAFAKWQQENQVLQ
jgi:hypothetical protein